MLLNNRFEFRKKLGEGAYGAVYLCHDTRTGKLVAVKRSKALESGEGFTISELREINILKELSRQENSSICQLVDCFQLPNNSLCVVMEYLSGGSLSDILKHDVLFRPEHLKNLFLQITKAVQQLHVNFVMHRDLKPDNMIFSEDGQLKLIDFGMAK